MNFTDNIDKQIEDIITKGLDEGTVKVNIMKCGVSGPPETGKSHVRALMLGLPRPKERNSTQVATEADQVTNRIYTTEDLLDTGKRGWNVIKDGESFMPRVIANTLHDGEYRCEGAASASLDSGAERVQTSTGVKFCSLKDRFKIVRNIQKKLKELNGKKKRKRKGLNGLTFVYFVDTGGQPQFQEILPNFIRCDVNILVHVGTMHKLKQKLAQQTFSIANT